MAFRIVEGGDPKRTEITRPDPGPTGPHKLAPWAANVSTFRDIAVYVRQRGVVRSLALVRHVSQKPPQPRVHIRHGKIIMDFECPTHAIAHAAVISRRWATDLSLPQPRLTCLIRSDLAVPVTMRRDNVNLRCDLWVCHRSGGQVNRPCRLLRDHDLCRSGPDRLNRRIQVRDEIVYFPRGVHAGPIGCDSVRFVLYAQCIYRHAVMRHHGDIACYLSRPIGIMGRKQASSVSERAIAFVGARRTPGSAKNNGSAGHR